MKNVEPQFTHDCEHCTFVGQLFGHDIYTCPQGGHPTIVARWGDDGPDYRSGPMLGFPGSKLRLTLVQPLP